MKKSIVAALVVALIMSLMIPVYTGSSEAQAAENASIASSGLWTYTTEESGQLFGSADEQGNYGCGINMPNGKRITFVDYVTKKDFDIIDGENYYSYRFSDINKVVTITSRIKGVVTNKSGYFNTAGEVIVESYGWVEEVHYFDRGAWTLERYNYLGQLTARITKILSDVGNGRGIVTTITDSETAPTTPTSTPADFWPSYPTTQTQKPVATQVPAYATPTVKPTVPPFVAPTMAPTVPPFVAPTMAPTATPVTVPTAPPAVQPTQAPQEQQVAVPPSSTSSSGAFNFTKLKHRDKIEKAAYKSLKKFNKAAKKSGNWNVQRKYTRKKHTGKVVVTKIVLKGETAESIRTFKLYHYTVKSGRRYRSYFRQGGKPMSTSGVYDALRNPGGYMR